MAKPSVYNPQPCDGNCGTVLTGQPTEVGMGKGNFCIKCALALMGVATSLGIGYWVLVEFINFFLSGGNF